MPSNRSRQRQAHPHRRQGRVLGQRPAPLRDHIPHHAAAWLLRRFRRALLECDWQWLDLRHRRGPRDRSACRRAPGFVQHAEYTGLSGRRRQRLPASLSSEGRRYEARDDAPLSPGEGFTVAVAWQKGIVAPPPAARQWGWWLSDNAGLLRAGPGASGVRRLLSLRLEPGGPGPGQGHHHSALHAAARAWARPASRYVTQLWRRRHGPLPRPLVGLAVKGRLKIADDDDTSPSPSLRSRQDRKPLTAAERALYAGLPVGHARS